jgi:hypothetical protein
MYAIHDLGFPYCIVDSGSGTWLHLRGRDIGRAQTGTGRTAAFLVSINITLTL